MRLLPTLSSLDNVSLVDTVARLGSGLLLGLALLVMGTPAAAQPNTGGLEFTGDAFGEVSNPTAVDTISSGLTVEAWVRHNGNSSTDAVLVGNKIDLKNGSGFAIHLEGDGEDVHVAFRPSNDNSHHVVSDTPLEKGRWYHISGTYRDVSGGATTTLYINGEEDASVTNTGEFSEFKEFSLSNSNSLVIGSKADKGSNFLRGGLDDVRVWGRALSKVAIENNFTSERSSSADGLVSYFKLNGSSGDTFTNEITLSDGTSNDGTLTGPATLNAAGALPVAPADVHAKPGDGEVTVYFSQPSYASSSSVSEYTVYRTAQGGSRQEVTTLGSSATSYTDTGVQDTTLYFYEVTATTSGGVESDYSERTYATVTDRSGLRFSGGTVSFDKTASQENLEAGEEIGLDFWVKYDEASDKNAVVLANKSQGETDGYAVQFVGGGEEVRISFKPETDDDSFVISKTTLEAGQWYHVAATYTNTTSGATTELYINGALDVSNDHFDFEGRTNDEPLTFGGSPGGGNVFRGALSEVRIWDTASIQPSELIGKSLIGNESGLVTYFRFDEPDGSSVIRSSARPLSASLPSGVSLETPGPRPAAPTTVRARPVDGNVELHYQQPDYTQGSISEYTIYRTEQGGSRQQVNTVSASQTTYTDANASTGTVYSYEVTANTSDGRESDFSVQESVTTYSNPGGNALELSGTNSFVEFPETPSLQDLESGTAIGIDFWVKPSGESDSSAVLVGNKNNFEGDGYVIHLIREGNGFRIAFKPETDDDSFVTSNTTLKAGRWYHVAATYTSTSGGASTELYIDGEQEASVTHFDFDTIDSGNPLVIGSTPDKSSNFFQGAIDEVRVWSTAALTPSSLQDQILVGNEESLVGYWRFNEPSGSAMARSSAQPLTGTISGGSFVESNVYSQPPSIALSTDSLNFGEVRDDTTKTDTVTITNDGGSTLEGDVSLTDRTGFRFAGGSGSYSLSAGASKDVAVTFAPDSVRTFSDSLTVTHNGDSTGSPVHVSLDGVGTSATLAGTVWYPATSNESFVVESRALGGVTVRAATAEDTMTTTTASDGSYAFMDLPNDEYTLSVDVEGDSGHVETGDAYRTVRGFVGNAPFVNGFQSAIADIDGDGVDANDALQIQRFVLGRRTSFPVGSWRSATQTVSLTETAAKDVNLWAAQYGDARLDGSSTQTTAAPLIATAAQKATGKSAGDSETKAVKPGETFEVPVRLDQAATLGAYGLALEYPTEAVSFQGAEGPRSSLRAQTHDDGTVRLSWFDQSGGENPVEAASGSPIVTLSFRAAEDLDGRETFELGVEKGELADRTGQSIPDVQLTVPEVTLGAPAPDEFALKGNAPNPFRRRTQIRVDLPSDADVNVAVYNVLGQRVMTVERTLEAGSNRPISIDATGLSSGTFFYRVTAEIEGQTVKETGQMVQVR